MNMNIPKIKAKQYTNPVIKPNTKPTGITPAGGESVQFYPDPLEDKLSDPLEDNLILQTTNSTEAHQLLKSETEKLLDEGWEVVRISKRSYIAVQDDCEVYLHVCKKGVSARVFQYDNQ